MQAGQVGYLSAVSAILASENDRLEILETFLASLDDQLASLPPDSAESMLRGLSAVGTAEHEETAAGFLFELRDNEAFLRSRLTMQLTRRRVMGKVNEVQDSTEDVLRLIRSQAS